jgi:hypothetical protein
MTLIRSPVSSSCTFALAISLVAWSAVASCAIDNRTLRPADGEAGLGAETGDGGDTMASIQSPLGPACVDCILTQVGSPTWTPATVVLTAAPPGDTDDSLTVLEGLVAPNHRWETSTSTFGPGTPHLGPYDQELAELLGDSAFEATQNFFSTNLASPAGLLLLMIVIPSAGSTVGPSVDFRMGPLITAFPIEAASDWANGATLLTAAHQETAVPGDAFAGNGSHLLITFALSSAGTPGLTNLSGMCDWRILLTDSGGDGWEVHVPFKMNY